jgi:hypothetical protein
MKTTARMRASSLLRLALLALLPCLVDCRFQFDRALAAGELRGRVVVDSPTGGTLAASGVEVRVAGSSIRLKTDSQGLFAAHGLGAGDYTVSLTYDPRATGRPDALLTFNKLTIDAGNGLDLGTIRLSVSGSIGGRVLSSMGNPVREAALTVVDANGGAIPGLPVVISDGNGRYLLPFALPGTVYVQALYTDALEHQVLTARSDALTIMPRVLTAADVHLGAPTIPPLGTLTGKATYIHGVPSVSVELSTAGQTAPLAKDNLPASPFSVSGLAPGVYSLTVKAPNLLPVTLDNVVVNGDTDLGTIAFLQPQGVAIDCNGNGIPACAQGQTSGCDLDDDSDGVPDALEDAACRCRPGQLHQPSGACTPLHPCDQVTCDANATCMPVDGLPACGCNTGFAGDGLTCADVNECLAATYPCDVNASCTNTPGSYSCLCKAGYLGDGHACVQATVVSQLAVQPSTITKSNSGSWIDASFAVNKTIPNTGLSGTFASHPMSCSYNPDLRVYDCQYQLTGAEFADGAQGTATVLVTATDGAGASGSATATVTYDYRPLLSVNQAKLQYLRSPWGTQTPETIGGLTIVGGPVYEITPADVLSGQGSLDADTFSLDGVAPQAINVWGDAAATDARGSVKPTMDGLWPAYQLPFHSAYPSVLYVTGVDQLGKESAPVKITHNEWVATPNQNITHGIFQVTRVQASRDQPSEATSSVFPPIDFGVGRDASLAPSAEMTWARRGPSLSPPGRTNAAMAYDSARNRLVLFGGTGASGELSDTWESDGRAWSTFSSNAGTTPSARHGHSMAYDSARGRVVLFGGSDATDANIYEWSGQQWTAAVPTSTQNPAARTQASMAYDVQNRRVVMFGGTAPGTQAGNQEFWGWDGAAWTLLLPGGQTPPPRYGAAMGYDSLRGSLVLYGGTADGSTLLTDTWEFNGSLWSQPATTASAPQQVQSLPPLAFFPLTGAMALLDGATSKGDAAVPASKWAASQWSSLSATVPPPVPVVRTGAAVAYDDLLESAVLFGGTDPVMPAAPRNDLWQVDPSGNWTDISPSAATPGARSHFAMAYDSRRNTTVLFGGNRSVNGSDVALSDTWEWNGYGWTDKTNVVGGPKARAYAGMAYDPTRKVTVMYGGANTMTVPFPEVWEWDGTSWANKTPAQGPRPTACCRMGAAYNANPNALGVVFFGGIDAGNSVTSQETWLWDGTTFRQVSSVTTPSGRRLWAMAFDSVMSRMLVFGGQDQAGTQLGDTWSWDGGNWYDVSPAAGSPPIRAGAAMFADTLRARVLLFGGFNFLPGSPLVLNSLQDEWEWDGSSWAQRVTVSSPGPRYEAPIVFDSNRDQAVLFGGTNQSGQYSDQHWEQNATQSRTPAFHFDAHVASEGISPGSITALRARAFCGGTAPLQPGSTSPPTVGAALWGWNTGDSTGPAGWRSLDSNKTPLNATSPILAPDIPALLFSSSSPEQARAYFQERDRLASFQCRAPAPSGPGAGEAQVGVSHLEVRIQYMAP